MRFAAGITIDQVDFHFEKICDLLALTLWHSIGFDRLAYRNLTGRPRSRVRSGVDRQLGNWGFFSGGGAGEGCLRKPLPALRHWALG